MTLASIARDGGVACIVKERLHILKTHVSYLLLILKHAAVTLVLVGAPAF